MAQRVGHVQKPIKPATSWRDVIKVHPAADLFPLMSEAELPELGEDIKKNGLTSPIIFDAKTFSLLDGRNRLDAMELVGVPFEPRHWLPKNARWRSERWAIEIETPEGKRSVEAEVSHGDPYDYVISANIHRRHLTTEQRLQLVDQLTKARPELPANQIAKLAKVSPHTAIKSRKNLEASGDVCTVQTSVDTKGRTQPRQKSKPAKSTPGQKLADRLIPKHSVSGSSITSAVEIAVRLLIDLLAQGTKADAAKTAALLRKKLKADDIQHLFLWLGEVSGYGEAAS